MAGMHMQTFDPMLLSFHPLHTLAGLVPNCKIDSFFCSGKRQITLKLVCSE